MFDVAIIGCGPAGMTSAIYCRRFNMNVIVFEYNAPGGAIINTENISNYPGFKEVSGTDLALSMYSQMKNLNVVYNSHKVNKIIKNGEKDFSIFTDKEIKAKSIIIASGTYNKVLGLPTESRFFYHGISWCALCDGGLYKGKDVCVVGGGNSALSSALTLSAIVSKVYLVHRRDEFRSEKVLLDKVKNTTNIEIITNANIIVFNGIDTLTSVTLKVGLEEKTIGVSACFECIGKMPNTDFVRDLLSLDNEGYIITNNNLETSVNGIFAAGDVIQKKVRQIVTATNDGAVAAVSCQEYII